MMWRSIKEQYYRGDFKHLVTEEGRKNAPAETEHNGGLMEVREGQVVLTESREPGGEVDMRMFEKKAHEEEMEEQAREKALAAILEKNTTFSTGSGDIGKVNMERKGRWTRLSQARSKSTKVNIEQVTPQKRPAKEVQTEVEGIGGVKRALVTQESDLRLCEMNQVGQTVESNKEQQTQIQMVGDLADSGKDQSRLAQ
ncbi:unnamed protein product [Linum trigynum]|uniref:Uncharacterized protein n=1 Tax=Linum trigynum TaxID=586398 RepID=A0AAV2G650_9ROSI